MTSVIGPVQSHYREVSPIQSNYVNKSTRILNYNNERNAEEVITIENSSSISSRVYMP